MCSSIGVGFCPSTVWRGVWKYAVCDVANNVLVDKKRWLSFCNFSGNIHFPTIYRTIFCKNTLNLYVNMLIFYIVTKASQ